MKTKSMLVSAILVLAAVVSLRAAEAPKMEPTKPTSAEFEKMKSMVGSWKGKTDMGQGPVDMTLTYRLVAGGTVLEERVFAGTPNEMLTMYYEKNGKLALTHYCMLGNRPGMVLKSSDGNTLKFDFDENCGVNAEKETHMHSLTIKFEDADTVTSTCKALVEGKEMPDHPCTLKRIKAS